MLLATAACNFSTSELQKLLRDRQFFNILTWKCASRHSGVQFFDIGTSKSAPRPFFDILTWKCASRHSGVQFFNISTSKSAPNLCIFTSKCASRHSGVQFFDIVTSKSGPKLTCFVHFHFEMCFSPQRRAIFQHLNFKKCPDNVSLLAFSLQNVLLATAACNFSTSQLQKVLRTPQFVLAFSLHGSAPAALTSLLFDSPDTRIIGKTQHFATSLTFGAGESSFF